MKKLLFVVVVVLTLITGCQKEVYNPVRITPSVKKQERVRTIKWVENSFPGARGVAVTNKLWSPGDTVRIKFLNGGNVIQEKVKEYAAIWLEYAYLIFEYVSSNEYADVKIGFDLDDRFLSWAVLGTDCRLIPQNQPSLNFVWLEDEKDEKIIRGEVLRGFGHILGLGFEHRCPESPVVFNARARSYFIGTWGLSADEVDNHILPFYTNDQTNYTEYDRNSIMVLEIPSSILSNRGESTTFNTELSATDTVFIASIYPYPLIKFISNITGGIENFGIGIHATEDIFVDWGNGDTTWVPAGTTSPKNMKISYSQLDTLNGQSVAIYGPRTAIRYFSCHGMQVSEMDIFRNVNLKYLACGENCLAKLDVSKNKQLQVLSCHMNQLNNLDISQNTELLAIWVQDNPLSKLDISWNKKLEELIIGGSFSYSEMLNIANYIVDRKGETKGKVYYLPYDLSLSNIFERKNWASVKEVTNLYKYEHLIFD